MADDHTRASDASGEDSARQGRNGGRFLFPRWSNLMGPASAVIAVGGLVYLVVLVTAVFHPNNSAIGYAPEQPVPFSHALHAGELGMDCRYCHNTVEQAAHAAIPSAETCMNCHQNIRTESAKLLPIREAYATGEPVAWVRVHDLADYSYFDHSAHVGAGVGCVSCHGRIDRMEVVSQQEELTMSWCLDCHRDPEPHLRPRDQVTSMEWMPEEDPAVLGARLREIHDIDPSIDCTTCHR